MHARIGRRAAALAVVVLLASPCRGRAAESCDPAAPPRVRATVLARASACYLAHRLPDAIALYRAWLAQDPNDRAVRVELARMLTESSDLAGAEAEYDRLLAGAGNDTDRRALHRARADVRAWRGELVPAIAEYQGLIAADPGDAGALLALGLAYQWSGMPAEAAVSLAAAVAADPQNVEAEKALAALNASPSHRAWQADAERRAYPDDAARWATAVDALASAEQFSVAESLLTSARERWPRDARFRGRERLLQAERKARGAERVAAAREALAAHPDDDPARLTLAAALADQGDLPAAAALYDEQLRRHPDDATTRRQLARTLSWAGRNGRALAEYDRLVAATPADTELRIEQARVLAWDGQLTESAHAIAGVRGSAPAAAERMLGDIYRWGGNRAAAARHYRAATLLGDGDENARAGRQFLASESGIAETLPTFNALQDSDGFHQRRVTVGARQRRGLATEVVAAIVHTDFEQHGKNLRVDRGRFSLLRDLDDRWRIAATWAPGVYDEDRTRHGATVELTRVFGPESQVTVGYDHYDLIDEVLTLASADQRILNANRGRMAARHVLPWRFEAAGNASVADYSDGNRLVALQASLARRVLRRPGVTLKVDAGYLGNAARSDLYWDPKRYATQGLTAVLRQDIVPKMSVQLEARVGYGQEEGQGSLERSFGATLAIAEMVGITAEVGYRYGETGRVGNVSGGGGSGYVAHSGTFALRYRFGAS